MKWINGNKYQVALVTAIFIFCLSGMANAQNMPMKSFPGFTPSHNKPQDTLLVIEKQMNNQIGPMSNASFATHIYYVTYAKGDKIVYYKQDKHRQEGSITKIGDTYLIIDSVQVLLKDIKQVSKTAIDSDAMIMTQAELDKLKSNNTEKDNQRLRELKKAERDLTQKRKERSYVQRSKEFIYPHSLTVNICEPFANQITITYGYRFNKFVGVDVSPGIYFQTDRQGPAIPHLEYADIHPGMEYDKNRLKGYQLNLGLKFYFLSKPNRYIELLGFGRYWFYSNENVLVYFYHDSYSHSAQQSETSWVGGFNILYGWQKTFGKHLTMDFFFGLGAYDRSAEITEYSGGYHPGSIAPITYPYTYRTGAVFFSFQGGIKLGMRFGRARINL